MKDICPCYGCTDRTATCHAECVDRYLPWSKRNEQRREAKKAVTDAEVVADSHRIGACRRTKKYKNVGGR